MRYRGGHGYGDCFYWFSLLVIFYCKKKAIKTLPPAGVEPAALRLKAARSTN